MLLAGPTSAAARRAEHAVWAIQQMGVGAVIAPSFGDIFRNNSAKMGLLTIALAAGRRRASDAARRGRAERIDHGRPRGADRHRQRWLRAQLRVAPFVKHRLLNGLDDISMTLEYEPTSPPSKRPAPPRCPAPRSRRPELLSALSEKVSVPADGDTRITPSSARPLRRAPGRSSCVCPMGGASPCG